MPNSAALNPSRVAIRFANVVFVLGALCSILITAYAAYRIFTPIFAVYTVAQESNFYPGVRMFYVTAITAGIISAIFFGLGLRLKDHVKINLSLLFIATGISIYAVEAYLEFSQPRPNQSAVEIDLKNAPEKFLATVGRIVSDNRTKLEVVGELRSQDIEAYPTFNPTYLVTDEKSGLMSKTSKIFPIGSISKSLMVVANETGTWMTYVSDRHGFHNSDSAYDVDTIDIVMTGDSFTEGYAVRSDENISAALRIFGLNVINLGKGGNGSLLQYVTLREYAPLLRPRIVLYIYNEGDIGELSNELESPVLIRYLKEDEFSQDLVSRQDEIDDVLIRYVEGKTVEQIENRQQKQRQELGRIQLESTQLEIAHRKHFASKPLIKILKLRNLRKIIKLVPEPAAEMLTGPSQNPEMVPANQTYLKTTFEQTLEQANRLVSSWNGKLYFVYLSSNLSLYPEGHPWRDTVLSIAAELKLPIIDIHKEVISPHPDVGSLYPFRDPFNHFNGKGYRLIAEAIAERLKADGELQ